MYKNPFQIAMNQQDQAGWTYYYPSDPQRRWLCCQGYQYYQNGESCAINFTVMSYNILSQKLLNKHIYLYGSSPTGALKWECRSESLVREILCHDVDILCLQELEETDYNEIFKPNLVGYEGMYKKKTGGKPDGCAIFYKMDRFHLDKYIAVELRKHQEPLLNKDNVGLVAVFEPSGVDDENTKFCVSTTHLLFNPKRGDIKLVQLRLLLAEIDKMAFKGISPEGTVEYYPVILCGDFNSVPFSPLYNFVTLGNISCENMLTGNVSGQKEGFNKGAQMSSNCIELKALSINRENQYIDLVKARSPTGLQNFSALKSENLASEMHCFSDVAQNTSVESSEAHGFLKKHKKEVSKDNAFYHNFKFASAYKHFALDGSLEITTCHSKANCTVDYIFYTGPENINSSEKKEATSSLELLGVYSLLSLREMEVLGKLPNWSFPSDHMCLITRFALLSSPHISSNM